MIEGEMRFGYTTGACAAAGVMAALLFERGEPWDTVTFPALDGTMLHIPIKTVKKVDDGICVEVVKFSGDDPDITKDVSVFTTIRHIEGEVKFLAGKGIGVVTKKGLQVPVGEPSINPGPRKLIRQVIKDMTGVDGGLSVEISIPAGIALAKQTLNPVLGVEGGLSVIGTTGVLRPMSEEGFKNSLVPQIDVAREAGYDTLVFVPGNIGARIAAAWVLPKGAIVETSNFIGFMLEKAAERGIKRTLLLGHIGKLAKVAAGVFYTHNRIADARLETIAAYAAEAGLSMEKVGRLLATNTTEDALTILAEANLKDKVCARLAERAGIRCERYIFGKMQVGIVMVTMTGEILGMNDTAREIGRRFHWKLADNKWEDVT